MGSGITLDHDPHTAALQMLPGLKLNTIDILALKHSLKPLLGWCIKGGIFNRGVTAIAKFTMVTLTTKWTVDPDHCVEINRAAWDRDRHHVHQD